MTNKTETILCKLFYWIARLLSTYAMWCLVSYCYITTAFAIRGYADVGGEYILCWFASAIWFMAFKEFFKGEDKREKKNKRYTN